MKIAVTGEIRSGKDTVCEYIANRFGHAPYEKLYFAEGIEKIIRDYFPEAFEGNAKPRKHYQDIGQFMRTINPDVWVNQVNNKYEYLKRWRNINNFLCTDLRQQNEYDWLKKNGFTVIKVETEPEIRIERMKASGDKFELQDLLHPVEQQIKHLPADYVVTNNTTLDDLFTQVDFILEELKEGV
jgi:AAA domain